MKKILITGGAGFLGRHMIDAALKKGLRVRVIDNFSGSRPAALKPYRRKIEVVKGDIRNPGSVRGALKGIDTVFHFAAMRSVAKTMEDPKTCHDVNATGTLLLLEESCRARVKRFIFTSTSSVYGTGQPKQQREGGLLRPLSPYGMAKLAAEQYARYYYEHRGLPTTSVRIFNVYGPRQNPESRYSLVIPGVLEKLFKNRRPVIDGTGRQARDFTYVGDIIDALFRLAARRKTFGEVYNLGAGHPYSINQLVSMILKLYKTDLKAVHGPRRPGDPDRTCADISKARRDFGWIPRTPLKEGLRKTVSWALQNKSAF